MQIRKSTSLGSLFCFLHRLFSLEHSRRRSLLFPCWLYSFHSKSSSNELKNRTEVLSSAPFSNPPVIGTESDLKKHLNPEIKSKEEETCHFYFSSQKRRKCEVSELSELSETDERRGDKNYGFWGEQSLCERITITAPNVMVNGTSYRCYNVHDYYLSMAGFERKCSCSGSEHFRIMILSIGSFFPRSPFLTHYFSCLCILDGSRTIKREWKGTSRLLQRFVLFHFLSKELDEEELEDGLVVNPRTKIMTFLSDSVID